jgi:glutaredoxin-related protein
MTKEVILDLQFSISTYLGVRLLANTLVSHDYVKGIGLLGSGDVIEITSSGSEHKSLRKNRDGKLTFDIGSSATRVGLVCLELQESDGFFKMLDNDLLELSKEKIDQLFQDVIDILTNYKVKDKRKGFKYRAKNNTKNVPTEVEVSKTETSLRVTLLKSQENLL